MWTFALEVPCQRAGHFDLDQREKINSSIVFALFLILEQARRTFLERFDQRKDLIIFHSLDEHRPRGVEYFTQREGRGLRTSSGSLATLAAMRRASSRVTKIDRRPDSSSKCTCAIACPSLSSTRKQAGNSFTAHGGGKCRGRDDLVRSLSI